MIEVPLLLRFLYYYKHGRHVCTPTEVVSEQDLETVSFRSIFYFLQFLCGDYGLSLYP